MDKGAIKKFATTARIKLMEAVGQKAFELGITKDHVKEAEVYQDGFLINQTFYRQHEIKQREKLLHEIERKGYEHVIEEVAYTWFNRFIALRFMEVNDYLPSGVRIFSSIEPGKTEPDAMTEVLMLIDDLNLDEQKVYDLQDANADEDLFKYILIKQCNKLGEVMPTVFEKIEDETELLLPNNLIMENSVINDLVNNLAEEEWEDVEIIGWLYQFYNSELKEQVGGLKNNNVRKEHLPIVTQLFTPKWIVQYMVENSLGKLYDEFNPHNNLSKNWEYYLKSEQTSQFLLSVDNIEELKVIDPAAGSGHILIYVFDLLYDMYQEAGYNRREIPQLIFKYNIYGMDIDRRSTQIASIALWIKALEKDPSLIQRQVKLDFNLMEIVDTDTSLSEEAIDFFVNKTEEQSDIEQLQDAFKNGKQFGSLIVPPELDYSGYIERINELAGFENDLYNESLILELREKLLPLLLQGMHLNQKYDVVVTNPPYHNKFNPTLKKFMQKNYKDTKSDLYAAFIARTIEMSKGNGYAALMTPYTWMFISTHQKLRQFVLQEATISSLVQLEYSAFEEATVPICSFVIQNQQQDMVGEYVRLTDFKGAATQPVNIKKAASNATVDFRYRTDSGNFSDIPGSPIAYWASEQVRDIFKKGKMLGEIAEPKVGLQTGSNDRFLRLWYEVKRIKIGFELESREQAQASGLKWFPYNKGGSYRKWYGNFDYIVNWNKDGCAIRNFTDSKGKVRSRPQNTDFYFRKGLTWSFVSSSYFGIRFSPVGSLFDVGGSSLFPNKDDISSFLGFLTSKLPLYLLKYLNPTLNFQVGNISSLPILPFRNKSRIEQLSNNNIFTSKSDWDSFETSWDFKTHPFLEFQQGTSKLSDAFHNWQQEAENRFQTLKTNEEELNRIFIDLYGLQDELTPEVEEKDVTVNRADRLQDVKSFLSYAVGVMFGRYSLDAEGLAFAGGEFTQEDYQTFHPDAENVIPITDDAYFEDDIVTRFIYFLRLTFGEAHLEDNLDFLADTLTRKSSESSRQRIRRYFLKEFYKDHVRTYQKRPIYWLFDSGKQNGFKALVYLHRYQPGLVARIRTDYLHTLQQKYNEEIERKDMMLEADISKQEQTQAKKQKERLQKQVLECQNYDQLVAHVANQNIPLDLDDGVKVNYAKFQNIEIPQGEGKKPIKGNLLAKI